MVAMHFFEVLDSYDFFFKKELKLLCKPAGERVKDVKFKDVKFKDPKFKHEIFVRIDMKHSYFS